LGSEEIPECIFFLLGILNCNMYSTTRQPSLCPLGF